MEFKLKGDFIELDNLIKVLGFALSGAEAKVIIQSGIVKVNGVVEDKIRKKLRAGDCVDIEGNKFLIIY